MKSDEKCRFDVAANARLIRDDFQDACSGDDDTNSEGSEFFLWLIRDPLVAATVSGNALDGCGESEEDAADISLSASLRRGSQGARANVDEQMQEGAVRLEQHAEFLAVECCSPAQDLRHVAPGLDEGDDVSVFPCDVVVENELSQDSLPLFDRGRFAEVSCSRLVMSVASAENLEDGLNFVLGNGVVDLFARMEEIRLEGKNGGIIVGVIEQQKHGLILQSFLSACCREIIEQSCKSCSVDVLVFVSMRMQRR